MPNFGPPHLRASALHPDLARRLDAVIDGALAADRIVGAEVIASVDGRTVFRRAAGFIDREAGAPMREDAIFRLASYRSGSSRRRPWCWSDNTVSLSTVWSRHGSPGSNRAWRTDPRPPSPFASPSPTPPASPWPRRMADTNRRPTTPGLAEVAMDPIRALDSHAFASGGAGMVGTADDVLRLLEVLRKGGAPILPHALVAEMARDQLGDIAVTGWPGWGHGLGFSVLRDQKAAGAPEWRGAWRWGGAYGHSWFVDPAETLAVVALTNTAFEGMSGGGRFAQDLCRACYRG